MLKTKNKIIIILAIIAILSTCTFGVFAVVDLTAPKLADNITLRSSETLKADLKTSSLIDVLVSQGRKEEYIADQMDTFMLMYDMYNMSADEASLIFDLVNQGKELDRLIEIYQFLVYTDLSIDKMSEIYHVGLEHEFAGNHWVENAYNIVRGGESSILTGEEILQYFHAGLSAQDISLANLLSRNDVYDIKQILEKIQNRESFIDIAKKVYKDTKFDKSIVAEEEPLMNVITTIVIAKRYKADSSKLYVQSDGDARKYIQENGSSKALSLQLEIPNDEAVSDNHQLSAETIEKDEIVADGLQTDNEMTEKNETAVNDLENTNEEEQQ